MFYRVLFFYTPIILRCKRIEDSYSTVLMNWGCGLHSSGREMSSGAGFVSLPILC